MRILTADEMRRVDRRAIEEVGLPGMVLMENAALGVVEALAEAYPAARAIGVVCGPGNNGGDGLAVARLLETRGYRCQVFLLVKKPPTGDAAAQLAILRQLGIPVREMAPEESLEALGQAGPRCDLWVDALFGTGLGRPLEGGFADVVHWLNGLAAPVLAVDLPSGLDGSRGEVIGPHVVARQTVTFAAPKVAHIFPPAADAVGELAVTDLGFPAQLVEEVPGSLYLLTAAELAACLLPRPADGHKGSFGHPLLVAGAPGTAGAAILAARAAVRGGAGLVSVAVPAPILPVVDGGSIESMTLPLPADAAGYLASDAARAVLAAAEGKSAVALGPGLGQHWEVAQVVRQLAHHLPLPLLLDADGLNAHAGHLDDLAARRHPTVLTPHPGEMGRLLGRTAAAVQEDRQGAAREAASRAAAVVVLKGHRTLVATPEGEVFVNPTGHVGMATGGSGDVLTGLLAAFLGQGYDALTACQLAVFLHGLAADLMAETMPPQALKAMDLVDALAPAFVRLEEA